MVTNKIDLKTGAVVAVVLGIIFIFLFNIKNIKDIFSALFSKSEDSKKTEEIQKTSVTGTPYDPKYYQKPADKKVKTVKVLKQAVVNGIIVGMYYSIHDRLLNDPDEFMKWLYKISYKSQFSQVADNYAKRYGKDLKSDMESFNNEHYLKINSYIDSLPSGYE